MRENRNNYSSQNNFSDRDDDTSRFPDLVRKEQEYRHNWQDKYLKSTTLSFRLGQIFGIIYNLALLAMIYDLVQDGEKDLALKIFFGNIILIAFALLVTSIERKVLSKKPPRRGGGNNRFNKVRDNRRDDRRDHRNKR